MNLFLPSKEPPLLLNNPCELEAKNLCFTSGEKRGIPASSSDKRVIDGFDIKVLTEINFVSI